MPTANVSLLGLSRFGLIASILNRNLIFEEIRALLVNPASLGRPLVALAQSRVFPLRFSVTHHAGYRQTYVESPIVAKLVRAVYVLAGVSIGARVAVRVVSFFLNNDNALFDFGTSPLEGCLLPENEPFLTLIEYVLCFRSCFSIHNGLHVIDAEAVNKPKLCQPPTG